ncbi:MAG: hypothetical protein N838_08160 [Thiohalocapsa sp. PB-PSB1]|nr:MAG: hypothetical protein N838_08160 [Thiohalocapsa sp. PB-PSB1]
MQTANHIFDALSHLAQRSGFRFREFLPRLDYASCSFAE